MNITDAQALPVGLYIIRWKDDGVSTAAIGQNTDGTRWIAPTNWLAPGQLAKHAEAIAYVQMLERQGGLSGAIYLGEPIR